MTKSNPTPSSAPLARDGHGNPILLPPGTSQWRIRRQTGGRPRNVLGPDRQPLRLPLDVTLADLDDMLGPGSYRLDAIGDDGQQLGVTISVTVPGPGDDQEDDDEDDRREPMPELASLPMTGSDLRILLEANVRAMQLSFHHNQRTLETSLRVVDSLRDGVRVLAETQADWIKSLATSRSIPRNSFVPWPAAANANQPEKEQDEEEDDNEDEEDDEEGADEGQTSAWDVVYGLTEHLKPMIDVGAEIVRAKFVPQPRNAAPPPSAEPPPSSTPPASDAPKAGPAGDRRPPRPRASWMPSPALLAKINALKQRLGADELQLVVHHLQTMSEEERERWTETLLPLSIEDALVRVRHALAMIGTERGGAAA